MKNLQVLFPIFLIVVSIESVSDAQSYVENILYNFGASSTDGTSPYGGLVMDSKGNLYGTTYSGGGSANCPGGCGSVFKLSLTGQETVLHAFTGVATGDGANPTAGLAIDKSGNLYGTTYSGGLAVNEGTYACSSSGGTVFKITAAGKYSILHKFGRLANDGLNPGGTLVLDSGGNIYGTTACGGTFLTDYTNSGTVFKITSKGVESVLLSLFAAGMNLIRDGKGNIYSTTLEGGTGVNSAYCSEDCGTAIKLSSAGQESVLYNFCSDSGIQCVDGAVPGYLARSGSSGDFYGTATSGSYGGGMIWQLTTQNMESVVYAFCGAANCSDGVNPTGPLLLSGGTIYGTTSQGGAFYNGQSTSGSGTVYSLTTAGAQTVLHSFPENASDGFTPVGGVIMDSTGNLYGTTKAGGLNGFGTIFKLTSQ